MNKEQIATAIQYWLRDDNARVGPERIAIGHNFDMLADRILALFGEDRRANDAAMVALLHGAEYR